jgi:hypothetical protein
VEAFKIIRLSMAAAIGYGSLHDQIELRVAHVERAYRFP